MEIPCLSNQVFKIFDIDHDNTYEILRVSPAQIDVLYYNHTLEQWNILLNITNLSGYEYQVFDISYERSFSTTLLMITQKDIDTIQKVTFLSGCLLNYADDLESNTLFRQELKKESKRYFNFISKFEANILNIKDEAELKELSEQLHQSYLAIDNLIQIQFNLKNDSQRKYFNDEVEKLVTKFNLL